MQSCLRPSASTLRAVAMTAARAHTPLDAGCPGSFHHRIALFRPQPLGFGTSRMGILSDFFLAQNTSIPNYAGGEEIDTADKCQFKGLSPLQGGQFLAVLRGQKYVVDM